MDDYDVNTLIESKNEWFNCIIEYFNTTNYYWF